MKLIDGRPQKLGVFRPNGHQLASSVTQKSDESGLLSFAQYAPSSNQVKSSDRSMSEYAFLLNIPYWPRCRATLEGGFDGDEPLAVDAVDQLGQPL